MALWMRVLQVMLAEQVLAVIVSIRGSHDGVNMLGIGHNRPFLEMTRSDWQLLIEFDEDDRAMNAVIEDAIGLDSANP